MASEPVQQQISDVYASSNLVVFVEVASGEIVRKNEQKCGTNYRLRIVKGFKGISTEYLDVTDRSGVVGAVGSRAVMFLYKTDGFRPGNYPQYSGLSKFIDSCSTDAPEIQPVHVLQQTYHPESVGMNGFIIQEALLAVPRNVSKLCAAPKGSGSSYPAVVDQEDVFGYLETLEDGT